MKERPAFSLDTRIAYDDVPSSKAAKKPAPTKVISTHFIDTQYVV
jgi:hypothetical protein